MFTVPFVSTDTKLYSRVKSVIAAGAQDHYDLIPLTNTPSAEDHLTAEMPELIFIDFSDRRIDAFRLIEALLKGPRPPRGGIIALCKEHRTVERINALRDANLLVSLTSADIEKQLPRLFDIIRHNRPLLSWRGSGADARGVVAGSFSLRNDLIEANCCVNLICNYLYTTGRFVVEKKYFFHAALYEMVVNAIEHGNCGITYDEKSAFLEKGGTTPDLVREKCRDGAVAARMVTFTYNIKPSSARFVIADEGKGFDWRSTIDTMHEKDHLRLHGRGILIARESVRSLRYNDRGNEVVLDIDFGTGGGPSEGKGSL